MLPLTGGEASPGQAARASQEQNNSLASGQLDNGTMSTRTSAALPPALVERRTPRAKAKEAPVAVPTVNRMTRKRTSDWDPYEVWKTRVKSPVKSK